MRYHHPLAYEWQARRNGFALEKRLEASDRRFKIFRANQMPLAEEALLVDKWSVVSPMVTYQVLSYQLARTTLADNLYLAAFLLLSAGVSALARSSATSLVVLMLTWAVWTVVIPQTAYLYGMQTVDFDYDWNDKQWDLRNETENALAQDGISLRHSAQAAIDNSALERRFAREMEDVEAQQHRMGLQALAREMEQYEAARTINLLSPGYAFQYSVEAMLGTGVERRKDFFAQAIRHREAIRQFLRGRDADDADSPHVLFLPDYVSKKPLDSKLIPHFQQVPLSTADGVAAGVVPIVILILEAALGFFFAFTAFLRMELAGFLRMELAGGS